MVRFSASEALYEQQVIPAGQPEELELGPFPDYVELTYQHLRVGPDGNTIANYHEGLWVVGEDAVRHGDWTTFTPAANGLRFSDVAITARLAA